ncbi:MAG TPA: hypothetical protein VHZ26_09040 [Caulobacteraceae bacterium]|nr:hypothetical protein [Caulobacteraceae bacterium]
MTQSISRRGGRPTKHTLKLERAICEAIARTPQGLRTVCADHEDFPDPRTVYRWLADNEDFRQAYAGACERRADLLVDQCIDIADDARNDWMERQVADGTIVMVPNPEVVQRSRLRVETRLKMAAKLAPKKYGERIEHQGEVGVKVEIVRFGAQSGSDSEPRLQATVAPIAAIGQGRR